MCIKKVLTSFFVIRKTHRLSLSLHAGYGHSTPHTIGGKLFTMAYALVGIPLGLVMFQSIGERLNNFSSFVIRNVKRVLKYENVEASETNLIIVVTVLLYSFLYVGYINME